MKNRILAGLLALILGTFGVHRFYLNDIPGGIFYLFLFFISSKLIFPISSILGIIEAVRIFNMSNAEFDEKYNHGKRDKHGRVISHRNVREIRRPKRRKSLFPKKNPFKKSALEKFENYDFKGAISDYRKALDISPDDPELHFQIARAYSLTEEPELAFRHLDTAVRYGLKKPEKIDTDEDLAFIRIQPQYEAFKANGYEIPEKAIGPEKKDLLDDDLLLAQLKKLSELKKKGLLNDTEYKIEKKKLMELKR
jgi:TM2 domain-containing membrane protein YozV